jgi:regulator of protease activity HflC (stomatin/prohibitin superfamily)
VTARAVSRGAQAAKAELFLGLIFLMLAVALLAIAVSGHLHLALPKSPTFALASAFFILSGTFLSIYCLTVAKNRPAFVPVRLESLDEQSSRRFSRVIRVFSHRLTGRLRQINWQATWLPLFLIALTSLLAIFCVFKGWKVRTAPTAILLDQWVVGVLIVTAFPMLVLERRFSAMAKDGNDTFETFTYQLRLLLLNLLGMSLAYALRWFALPFSDLIQDIVFVFNGLVALELLLRISAYLFVPLAPLASRRNYADSSLTRIIKLQRPSLKALGSSVNSQFGVDLGRSWALNFIRQSLLYIVAGLIFSSWLLSGVVTLNLSQRAIYEAFGIPQTVFYSGFHVYLPWPIGRLKPVEYGVVHEIPIAFAQTDDQEPITYDKVSAGTSTIEGAPVPAEDRLWEASRPTEDSYLVASNQNGRENFEVLNVDLRIIYRIGLSDAAAYSAVYSLDSPEDLIRAAAGRMLAQYFARYSVNAVLGQNRDAFVRGFQKELQTRLNSISPSVDILGIVIETIHPPAGAAEAYQQVQAASIDAVTKVANAKGDAVRDVHQAQSDSTDARNAAIAAAAETVADAKVGTALFAGDVEAYKAGGSAFLFERRLADLNAAVTPDTHLTIVDARIPMNQAQMMQFRSAPAQAGSP